MTIILNCFESEWAEAGGLTLIQEVKVTFHLSQVIVLADNPTIEMAFAAGRMQADVYLQNNTANEATLADLIRNRLRVFDTAFHHHYKKE